jgi:hypothetical protein
MSWMAVFVLWLLNLRVLLHFHFLFPSLCGMSMFKTLYSVLNTCHFLKSSKSLYVSAWTGHPQVLIVVFLRRLLLFYSVMLVRPFVFRVCLVVSLPTCDSHDMTGCKCKIFVFYVGSDGRFCDVSFPPIFFLLVRIFWGVFSVVVWCVSVADGVLRFPINLRFQHIQRSV